MEGLIRQLLTMPQLRELTAGIDGREKHSMITGLSPVQRASVAAAAAEQTGRPLLMLCADEQECARQTADLRALTGREPVMLPARELQLRPAAAYSRQWEYRRLWALYRLAQEKPRVMVATAAAMAQLCLPPEVLRQTAFTLEVGQQYDVTALTARLIAAGYVRAQQVEGAGQFALRGGILDIFSPGPDRPVRCEFFDDELDSMGDFDVTTQRRVENRQRFTVLPAGEVLPFHDADTAENTARRIDAAAKRLARRENAAALRQRLEEDAQSLRQGVTPPGGDRYLTAVYPDAATAFGYLPEDCLICVSEAGRVQEALKAFVWQVKQDVTASMEAGLMAGAFGRLTLTETETAAELERFPVCQMESLPTSRYLVAPKLLLDIPAKQLSSYGGSLETAATDIVHYLTAGYGVLVLCGGEVRARNMQQLLRDRKIPAALELSGSAAPQRGQVCITVGALSAGSEWPALKLAVLTEGQLTERLSGSRKKPRPAKADNRQKIQSYTDLAVGDLVVHVHHGIGRFAGMLRLPVDGVEKDYIKINYAGSDCLYVPATSLDLVSKYIGGGDEAAEKTKLNKLSGDQWAKTTRRAKAAAKDLAEGLIKLYAQRQRRPGFAFSPDSPWQQEFEESFDYTETDDQLAAIRDIKRDMEKPAPMDRLLCGDVGYGKTEVALRAAMKCILDGKQAAILVPTTVLAQQHYATAIARFRAFPVTVEVLSRFRTPAQVKDVLERVKEGRVDLLIGTHKLLAKNVEFKDLGLLIIDEEQRFGVTHKEKLRQRAEQVDTLTLSATPIPRTLNMALSGIRDMSTIEQPPQDRQPVQTYVLEHDWGIIAEAIRRELDRGGQVYYLHNRVENIDSTASRLRQLLGDGVTVDTAHGKMAEGELSRVMSRMAEGDIDVLVCTTIIETGLDISNANTLIVDHADRFGLSQLHQLRGRVGRGRERAYAYFLYDPTKPMTQQSHDRLATIAQNTALGSGFDVAMKDLELRGTGNLLGDEQSGHIEGVGFDLYVRMVSEAVEQYKEPERKESVAVTIDLPIEASIPVDYIDSDKLRLEAYQKLASARTEDDLDELRDELTDRYGKPPVDFEALFDVARLRFKARKLGISEIIAQGRNVRVSKFEPRESVQMRMARIYKGIQYRPLTKTYLVPAPFAGSLGSKPMSSDEVVGWTSQLLDDLDWKPTPRQ